MAAKDKLEPKIELELDGEVRKLVFNHLAILAIEETEGALFIEEAGKEMQDKKGGMSMRTLIVLLWGCLLTDCPELDVRKEEDLRFARRKVALWLVDNNAKVAANVAVIKALVSSAILPPKAGEAEEKESDSKNEAPVPETGVNN